MHSVEIKSSNRKNEKNINTYDILRVIATLLVILSHCGYYNIITKYGGIRYGEELNLIYGDTLVHVLFSALVKFVYTFHMPLFIGLSGALFYIQVKNNRFKSIKLLIVNKAKRLLIPFLLITLIYSVPIKYISGYFENSIGLMKSIVIGQVLIQGNTYLWFLPTLFFCFIIVYLSEKYIDVKSRYKIIVLILFNIISYIIPILIIKYIFQYTIWFYFGFLFEPLREAVNRKLEMNKGICLAILLTIASLYLIIETITFGDIFIFKIIEKSIMLCITMAECFFMYILSFKLSKMNIYNGTIFRELLSSSFGLYLYSDPINYLVLFIIYRVSGFSMFITEIGALIIIILRIIITFFIAFIITKILRRLKVKYIV